jgi:outer membrane protein
MTEQFSLIRRVTALAALFMLVFATAASAEMKIAFVDMQRALNECNAGKKAKTDFRSEISRLQGKLQRQQSEIQSLKSELEKKGMLMRDDQRRNLQDDYTRKLRDFERSYKDSKDELQQKDNEVTGAIIRDLAYVVRTVGERDGYTLILEKGSLLWGMSSIDITDQVIRQYNASGGKIGSLGERLLQNRSASSSRSLGGTLGQRGGQGEEEASAPPVRSKRSTISK